MEQTWVPFNGAPSSGDEQPFVAVSYPRLVQYVTLRASGAPSGAACVVQFKIGATLQAQQFTLADGVLAPTQHAVTNGFAVPAGTVLTAVLTTASGVLDLVVVIESSTTATGTADVWFVPTVATLQRAIGAQEWDAFTASSLSTGQSDPVPGILSDSANEIRDAIRTGMKNDLGPVGTIPGGATNLFLQIAQYWFFKRVKALSYSDKDLDKMREDANVMLAKIADGDRKFIQPTTVYETIKDGLVGSEDYVEVDTNEEVWED